MRSEGVQGSHFKQDVCKGEASMSTGMRLGAATPEGPTEPDSECKGPSAEALPVGSVGRRQAGPSGQDRELEGEGRTSGP